MRNCFIKENDTFVVLDQNAKVVHLYNTSVHDENQELCEDFKSFLGRIGLNPRTIYEKSDFPETFEDAIFSVILTKRLTEMGNNSKFSKLFSS